MRKTCSEAPMRRLKLHGPTMATRWSLICDAGPEVDEPALRRNLAVVVDEVDRQMSPWKPKSDLTRLNASPADTWVSLPPAILEVLARALEISRLSDGAFDPAVGTLVDAWGFGAARGEPDVQAIGCARSEDGRPAHNWLELDLTAGRARKHARMQLDLCGIAKGYAVDRMIAVVQTHEVEHALAALDGELRALGHQGNGEPWAIALESPQYTQRTTRSVIELADLAVATSGDYRHWLQIGAVRVAHTMDGRSSVPVHNDVASVTVLARDGISADAWATALLVSGPNAGLALAQRMGLEALWLLRREGSLVELGLGRFANPL